MRSSLVPILFGGFRGTGGNALLAGQSQGLGIDFTTGDGLGSVAVRDSTTPANNRNNFSANSFLANNNASQKWVLGPNGVWVQKPANTVAIEYGASGYYALVEPAATNLALRSDDFTQAAWTLTTMTAVKTATGADGAANSASTLTATAGNATALQAITSSSNSRVTSCFIKRRTGTGNIDLTQDNGGTWTTQAVTAAWQKFSLAAVTATDPTVGIRIVTNGDAVDVMWFQHELTAVTSPAPTAGTTATRAADKITFATSAFPFSAVNNSFILSYNISSGATSGATGAASLQFGPITSGKLWEFKNNTTTQLNWFASGSTMAGYSAGSRQKIAATSTAAGVIRGCVNGGTVSGTAASDFTGSGTTTVALGGRTDGTRVTLGQFYSLVILPVFLSDAQLKANSL